MIGLRTTSVCRVHPQDELGLVCLQTSYDVCLGRFAIPLGNEMVRRRTGKCCNHQHLETPTPEQVAELDPLRAPATRENQSSQEPHACGRPSMRAMRWRNGLAESSRRWVKSTPRKPGPCTRGPPTSFHDPTNRNRTGDIDETLGRPQYRALQESRQSRFGHAAPPCKARKDCALGQRRPARLRQAA